MSVSRRFGLVLFHSFCFPLLGQQLLVPSESAFVYRRDTPFSSTMVATFLLPGSTLFFLLPSWPPQLLCMEQALRHCKFHVARNRARPLRTKFHALAGGAFGQEGQLESGAHRGRAWLSCRSRCSASRDLWEWLFFSRAVFSTVTPSHLPRKAALTDLACRIPHLHTPGPEVSHGVGEQDSLHLSRNYRFDPASPHLLWIQLREYGLPVAAHFFS